MKPSSGLIENGKNRTKPKITREMMKDMMDLIMHPPATDEEMTKSILSFGSNFMAGQGNNSSMAFDSYFDQLSSNHTNSSLFDDDWFNSLASNTTRPLTTSANTSVSDLIPSMFSGLNLNDSGSYKYNDSMFRDEDDSSDMTSFLDFGQSQSSLLAFFANLTMITFIYYIPRMFFFRAMRFSTEMSQPSFIPILVLSIIAMAGATCHIFSFYNEASQNMLVSFLSGKNPFDEKDNFAPYVWKSLCASLNRVISPIATLVVIQQMSMFSDISALRITTKIVFELIYCILAGSVVFVWTFYSNYAGYMNLKKDESVKENIDLSFLDVVPPILASTSFYFMRKTVARKQTYAEVNNGPNSPRTIDRVSKLIVFQQVMVIIAIVSFILRDPDSTGLLANAYTFFISAQTPVVQWVLMRSLLRSTKSRRLCFLFCCASEEKVSADQKTTEIITKNGKGNENGDINGGQKQNQLQSGRKTNRNIDDDDEDGPPAESDTQETLDHDKSIHVRV